MKSVIHKTQHTARTFIQHKYANGLTNTLCHKFSAKIFGPQNFYHKNEASQDDRKAYNNNRKLLNKKITK